MARLVLTKKYADLQYSTSKKNIEERVAVKDVKSLRITNKYLKHYKLYTKIENLQKENNY